MASRLTTLIDQDYLTVPQFELECGVELKQVPVAYKTWGKLNETRDNVMVICHAFTGSADVEDWWGPLMGKGKAFDPNRFFIFCGNVLGSPYGTASPVTVNPDTGRIYGPEFPPTTIRDDIRLHKLVLDELDITSIAVVIGGSMGGMAVLEWPLCTPPNYVRHIIPLATSARHSAWCISWGEAQRQSIYSDPNYHGGYYTTQPASGLAAARMAALLTYRSRDSFESRFGRRPQLPKNQSSTKERPDRVRGIITPPESPKLHTTDEALAIHNDGHRPTVITTSNATTSSATQPETTAATRPSTSSSSTSSSTSKPPIFSAQSYLRYQGDKFISRFDANCYIHITRKLDTHDVSRGRFSRFRTEYEQSVNSGINPDADTLAATETARVLATLPRSALIISIATDGLFTTSEQRELAEHIPDAELVVIPSPDGHDGFLLEFERINECVMRFLRREFPEYYQRNETEEEGEGEGEERERDFEIKKTSVFGEAEVDVTHW
ncbi:hypothetical protein AMATHDRAFT_77459 [Amanita thiersii Skay4041]|uniref:AB hydrolase-1 domain-containing protein n=1 Tax=Amanita thiersii Skay4041 TaxID=703135 RepID=A0A2A9NF54_9AGAR|nr:hypothetical protein AMATHDRAFT_77459 [Amanita thiersii Skay4041]